MKKFGKCTPQQFSQIQQRLQSETQLKLTQFVLKIAQRDAQDYAPLQRQAANSQINSHNLKNSIELTYS